MKRLALIVIATGLLLASPSFALEDKIIRDMQVPAERSQDEADICAAVFFDVSYETRDKNYETLATLWLMAATAGQGVESGKYKGLNRNRIYLRSWGPEPVKFWLRHCIERSDKLLEQAKVPGGVKGYVIKSE